MQLPDDFLQTLVSKPDTQTYFDSSRKSNKHIIYYVLSSAKKTDTRERRLAKYLLMLDNQ
ncbi:YdeI/OmpD-associated family protein [Pseudoalteromonas sp. APC 4017]|uniref:YdeI/OmpD-associated family protein n=1 Tax=unclassified Pseudoalteromonas TaxID=194690 RepID=UPI0025B5B9B9|nr:YdeI/OmpD-associated family protein [Pseudoalteromonas sp. APC 4017]MDN3380541.1 YdeI/OmpD-associated family protein [Pseudoalteromonas sp. APC 3893]